MRLRGLPEMRQALVGLLKGWLAGFGLRAGGTGGAGAAAGRSGGPVSGVGVPGGGAGGAPRGPLAAPLFPPSQASGARPYRAPFPPAAGPPPPAAPSPAGVPLYRGRVFGLFLLAELDDRLFLVDAHAAHERLLYEELRARPPRPQELLFPLRLEVSRDEGRRLLSRRASLEAELGLRLEPDGEDPDHLQVSALPEELLAVPEGELAEALVGGQGSPEELREALYRLAACRLAVKDGDPLDPLAAQKLIADVFPLPNARCPHGRPIWTVVRREDLLRAVGRPVPGEP